MIPLFLWIFVFWFKLFSTNYIIANNNFCRDPLGEKFVEALKVNNTLKEFTIGILILLKKNNNVKTGQVGFNDSIINELCKLGPKIGKKINISAYPTYSDNY